MYIFFRWNKWWTSCFYMWGCIPLLDVLLPLY